MRCLRSIVSVVLAAGGAWGCGQTGGPMTAAELAVRLREGTAPVVLDARSAGEYARDRVPGARHVGVFGAGQRAAALGIARDAPLVVYCEHGPRALVARAALQAAGYRRVQLLEGHMARWRAGGFPVER